MMLQNGIQNQNTLALRNTVEIKHMESNSFFTQGGTNKRMDQVDNNCCCILIHKLLEIYSP